VHGSAPYFEQALQATDTVFTHHREDNGTMVFAYARRVVVPGQRDGVIVVLVDLARFERGWAGISDAVMVTDSRGTVLLATEPQWRGRSEAEALSEAAAQPVAKPETDAQTAPVPGRPEISPAPRAEGWAAGTAMLRSDARVPFQGWRIASFTPFQPVRDRVNGVLALETALLALLMTAAFYVTSRQARARSVQLQRDADELRALNARLGQEIAERKRAEANLQVAEQTLEQSSKLAALGEMSAAVSHELNQPLAAMRTYLAGARLLVQRDCPEEALASFRRIDDLIERMGAITRQLKSHARRGGDAVGPMDMRDALSSALSMMEPQLKARDVQLVCTLPEGPVPVVADRLRVEQVLINLFRNALDATRDSPRARIDVILSAGETATVTVRDNGHGIAELETLFEPFYTTKPPGDGVGLGLAIASGIVAEFAGSLTARNGAQGGAVFEVKLPMGGTDGVSSAPASDQERRASR
jgi:two-component system C4-dicarboxylate transport sensor histidine kinase DctB